MTAKRTGAALSVLLLVVGWWWLAPRSVGGRANYVVTHGTSMLPRFHTGDLAIVQPAARYRVGDVVAYRSKLLHTIVLHRIVARDGQTFVFKGDHNSWLDPEHPTKAGLVGRLWVHVPRGGAVLGTLHRPAVAAAIAIALLLLTAGTTTRRRRRPRHTEGGNRMPTLPFPVTNKTAAALGALTALLAAVAAFAFIRPVTVAATTKLPYTQQVAVGYTAATTPNPAYPDGQIHNGSPIFRRLAHIVLIKADYRFAATAKHHIIGTTELTATVTAAPGWVRTIRLTAPRAFTGDTAHVSAALNFDSIDRLVGQIGAATAMLVSNYTVTVNTTIHADGTLADQPLGPFASTAPLAFVVDPLRAQPAGSNPAAPNANAGTSVDGHSSAGSITIPTTRNAGWKLAGHHLSVRTLRALGATFTALSALLLLAAVHLRPRGARESDRIAAAHRNRLITINTREPAPTRTVIDVTSIDALVRIADRYDRVLLHHPDRDSDTYLVDDDSTIYRYQVRQSARSRRGGRGTRRRTA